jgi:hypothetical protein
MFPVAKTTLSFSEISNYWSREIQPPATQKELFRLLEGAWWLGEIHGDSASSRLDLLKRMFKSMWHRDDLGVVFVVGDDTGEQLVKKLPDGTVLVKVKHLIRLPSSDIDTWDDNACIDAFHALAQTSSVESCPEVAPGLAFIELSYDEFIGWLTRRGFHEPKFWRPYNASPPVAQTTNSCAAQLSDSAKNLVENYVAQTKADGQQPTQKGAVVAAQAAGWRGGREAIRKAFAENLGPDAPGRGRPKNPTNKSPTE